MDEQEQVVHGRRRRCRAEAAQLVAEYEASGLRRAEFCGTHRLSLSTLTRYQQRQREAGGETLSANRWVSVEVATPKPAGWTGSGLAVTLAAGRRIDVGRGFDAQTLVELLGVLDRF